MSLELDLMFAPARTYRRAALRWPVGGPAALRRPAIVAVVIGGALSVSATGSADVRTVLSATLCWAWVPALQSLLALALVASAPPPTLSRTAALDLFFASHAPWSLWILADAVWAAASPVSFHTPLVFVTAVVPIGWTIVIIYAFCAHALRLAPRDALVRTALHQVVTWGLALLFFGWAVQFWPRALGAIGW